MSLGDIESIDFAKALNYYDFWVYAGGQRHDIAITVATTDSELTCQALESLITEAQGKETVSREGVYLVTGGLVAVPLREDFFVEGQGPGDIVLKAVVEFPPTCAWCRSPDVVDNREIWLHKRVLLRKASLGKWLGGFLLARVTLLGGFLLHESGKPKEGDLRIKLEVPACKRHQDAPTSPELQIRGVDWKRGLCLLDLKDKEYATEFCRYNAR